MAAEKSAANPARKRTIAEIEAELDASRENLVVTVDQLQTAVKQAPKKFIAARIEKLRGIYVDEYGGIRPERVAITVGVVVAVVVVRRVAKRGKKD